MAKQPKSLDRETVYRVELNRSIQVGRHPVHPGPNVKLRGDVIEAAMAADPDAVKSYEPAKEVGA